MKATIHKKTIAQGINLRGTRQQGFSALALRKSNPALAEKWAQFIKANKAALVAEISGKVQ